MEITKDAVSVSEMSQMLSLSRARFYQLIGQGVFPPPSRSDPKSRPMYDRELQTKCIDVRRTNRGINGQVILFYALRSQPLVPKPTPQRRHRSTKPEPAEARVEPLIGELRHGLTQLGIGEISESTIRTALTEQYPDGHAGIEAGELLRAVFARLNRRDSRDNVS